MITSKARKFDIVAAIISGLVIAILSSWVIVLALELIVWPIEFVSGGEITISWKAITLLVWAFFSYFVWKGGLE